MITNVSTLLREFPKIRRAALSGEEVIVHTREGDLLIQAAPAKERSIIGALKGSCIYYDDNLHEPTTTDSEWDSTL